MTVLDMNVALYHLAGKLADPLPTVDVHVSVISEIKLAPDEAQVEKPNWLTDDNRQVSAPKFYDASTMGTKAPAWTGEGGRLKAFRNSIHAVVQRALSTSKSRRINISATRLA